jgi:hypothetical protein
MEIRNRMKILKEVFWNGFKRKKEDNKVPL